MVYDGYGNWREINEAGARSQAVTAADVQRVAQKYFTKENRAVAIYTRKASAVPDDPDLAGLSAEQKAQLKPQLDRLKTETDPGKLKPLVSRLEQSADQAPPEAKPMIEVMLKKLRARIAELETK